MLLIEIANKFMKYDNKKNIVGRQGADEFIIICKDINNEVELSNLAMKIINDFKEIIYVRNIPFNIDIRIGGVLYPRDGKDKLTLIQKADMAMYTSKSSPHSQFNLYKEEINTSDKIKMEALLKNALSQLKEWNDLYDLTLEMGINISPIQLSSEHFLNTVISSLDKSGINPSLINLEITEESAINNIEANIKKLSKIRELGVKVSIDDFGNGYSSFKYLKTFVVDTLKIDMSLIKGIDKTKEDYEIAKAIINLGKGLHLNIIAEGVESESQLSVLKKLNCNVVQGYYHEKPLMVADLERKYFK